MTTGNTALLGLALPVEGELDGTWGDTVNDSITSLVDSAVAGTTTLSADADVTLTDTVLAANQARQAVILWTASNGATTRNITAPARSKAYIVVNAGTGSVVLRGAGPTTGVTIISGERCLAAWNGSDFVKIATSTVDGVSTFSAGTTGFTPSTATSGTVTLAGTLATTNGGTGLTAFTANRVFYASSTSAIGQSANLTFDGTTLVANNFTDSSLTSGRVTYAGTGGNLVDSANLTFDGTTLTANALTVTNAVTLSAATANGVMYANGSKVLTTGSALTFDGAEFGFTRSIAPFFRSTESSTGIVSYFGSYATGAYIGTTSNHPVQFFVNAAEQMRLTSTGLGIGNSSPTAKLDVTGTAAISGAVTLSGGTANGVAYLNGSKVLTTGSALTFNGTSLGVGSSSYGDAGTITASIGVPGTTTGGLQLWSTTSGQHFVSFGDGTSGTDTYRGYVGYAHASDALIFGASTAEQMRLTSTGLGIGTSSPGAKLDVSGGMRALSSTPSIPASGTGLEIYYASGTFTGAPSAYFISYDRTSAAYKPFNFDGSNYIFRTSGTASLVLDASGNLGLGVPPSAWSAHKILQVGAWASFGSFNGNLNSQVMNNAYWDGGAYRYIGSTNAAYYSQTTGVHAWYTAPSGTAGNAISFTQAMSLLANGNLLLGTTTDEGRLTVAEASTGIGVSFLSSNGNYAGRIGTTNEAGTTNGLDINATRGDGKILFKTAAVERARITSGGDLLIGTTSASGNGERLNVTGSSTSFIAYVDNTSTGARRGIISTYSGSSPPNDTGNEFIYCNDLSAVRMTVRSNGGIANFSGNDVNLSDRREKTNFAPAKSYLDTICAIPVQTFNYIDQNMEEDGGLTLGVVAQDVQAVAPELVMESNWAGKDEEPKMRLSIYQTDLQYALMKALQELKAEFDAYKASHP